MMYYVLDLMQVAIMSHLKRSIRRRSKKNGLVDRRVKLYGKVEKEVKEENGIKSKQVIKKI